jgi:hypothetical protein
VNSTKNTGGIHAQEPRTGFLQFESLGRDFS